MILNVFIMKKWYMSGEIWLQMLYNMHMYENITWYPIIMYNFMLHKTQKQIKNIFNLLPLKMTKIQRHPINTETKEHMPNNLYLDIIQPSSWLFLPANYWITAWLSFPPSLIGWEFSLIVLKGPSGPEIIWLKILWSRALHWYQFWHGGRVGETYSEWKYTKKLRISCVYCQWRGMSLWGTAHLGRWIHSWLGGLGDGRDIQSLCTSVLYFFLLDSVLGLIWTVGTMLPYSKTVISGPPLSATDYPSGLLPACSW